VQRERQREREEVVQIGPTECEHNERELKRTPQSTIKRPPSASSRGRYPTLGCPCHDTAVSCAWCGARGCENDVTHENVAVALRCLLDHSQELCAWGSAGALVEHVRRLDEILCALERGRFGSAERCSTCPLQTDGFTSPHPMVTPNLLFEGSQANIGVQRHSAGDSRCC
jgi:hypothetical protein